MPQAIITGGSGSLGTALRQELVAQGWDVLAPGRQEMDATDADSVQRWFLDKKPDLLVHAVGTTADGPFLTMTESAWEDVYTANLKSAFLCAQAAAGKMPPESLMVFLGSASSRIGTAGQSNYAAAKAGLIGLTKSLAKEWGPLGIRVNCVLPGWLEPSNLTAHVSPGARQVALDQHVLGKFNTPTAAAEFIVFLHRLLAVSGQVFQLDSRVLS